MMKSPATHAALVAEEIAGTVLSREAVEIAALESKLPLAPEAEQIAETFLSQKAVDVALVLGKTLWVPAAHCALAAKQIAETDPSQDAVEVVVVLGKIQGAPAAHVALAAKQAAEIYLSLKVVEIVAVLGKIQWAPAADAALAAKKIAETALSPEAVDIVVELGKMQWAPAVDACHVKSKFVDATVVFGAAWASMALQVHVIRGNPSMNMAVVCPIAGQIPQGRQQLWLQSPCQHFEFPFVFSMRNSVCLMTVDGLSIWWLATSALHNAGGHSSSAMLIVFWQLQHGLP